ncbi:unnamed protein product [Blepharisma stoltei]|uniref:FCP1 homology domain-containing protein n=1 Tax=Blepharisma stoltei TaxID=1481888 RepID=A0AAU9JJ62_9CILI|nr:unnamed protein product [Blepharisma stoltei]
MQPKLYSTRSTPRILTGNTKSPKYFSSVISSEIKQSSPKLSYGFPADISPSNIADSSKDSLLKKTTPRTPKTYSNPFSLTSQTPKSSKSIRNPIATVATPRNITTKSLTPRGSSLNPKSSETQPKQTIVSPSSTKSLFQKNSKSLSSTDPRKKSSQQISANLYQSDSADPHLGSPKTAETKNPLAQMITQVKTSENPKNSYELSPEEIQQKAESIYKEHLFQTFQALKFVRNLQPVDQNQLQLKRINLPKKAAFLNKKTIIFDLDETLVHCCEDLATSNPDVILPIIFPNGETINAGINIRPYAKEILVEANKNFEVIVFTASHQCYADVVLDYLDPTHELIHHRLYRDNCIFSQGIYIKDLRVLANRRMQDIIIVDNAAYSFGYQIDNGIPIISWHDDRYDKELLNLSDYIKVLAKVPDIRELNRKTFRLNTFYEDYIEQFLQLDEGKPKASSRKIKGKPKQN